MAPTGVSEINVPFAVSIYPNPNTGEFFIKTDNVESNSMVEVYNQMGQQVAALPLQNKITSLKLNQAATGVYIVKISSNGVVKNISRVIVK